MLPGSQRRDQRERPPHVAFLIETSTAFGRRLLRGAGLYVRENGPWSTYLEQRSIYDPAPPWLKDWDGDGILSRAAYADLAEVVLRTGLPTIDLQEQVLGLGLPSIINDNRAIGRMAAEHLLERGFGHFGFLGHSGIDWSERRGEGFRAAVEAAGYRCDEFHGAPRTLPRYHQRSWEKEMNDCADWVRGQPKPIGIMACNDFRAVQLLDACRRAGAAVPEQVAIIGVDNEEVACEMAYPALSSVVPNSLNIGYEAAAMLDRWMQGELPKEKAVLVPPTGIITRQSTDVTALEDPQVAQAVEFIRQRACEGIDVDAVAYHLAMSRSVLQRRFRKTLDKTVHEVILDQRLRKVKELLSETPLSLAEVARRAGFRHAEYLSTVFKQTTGMTTGAFRRMHRSAQQRRT